MHAQALQPRDRVAEGGPAGVTEDSDHALLDGLAHHVLPAARLVMDLVDVQAEDVGEQTLRQAVLAHHGGGQPATLLGHLEAAVRPDDDEVVALHAGDGLADRGAGLLEALGDAGTQRGDALFLELVDGPQIHLGGIDQVLHVREPFCSEVKTQLD